MKPVTTTLALLKYLTFYKIKMYGLGGTTPCTLNRSTGWTSVIRLTLQLLHSRVGLEAKATIHARAPTRN